MKLKDKKIEMFKINGLDHVAIRSSDTQRSATWYENTLGLKKVTKPEWDDYPIMMLSGQTGIAIFPSTSERSENDSKTVRIDHFAFNVDNEAFEKAKRHFETMNIQYNFQDHYYFHSIYMRDPDGHIVELTTAVL